MNSVRIAAIAALVSVTACDGLKEAMTAHVDVVARAESQELTVQRLAELMGGSTVPLSKAVAEQVADVWVNYQLLARAAADNDSLADNELIDKVMWPVYSQSKNQKWIQVIEQGYQLDTSEAAMQAAYDAQRGGLLAAQHILFEVPAGQAATVSDSVLARAERVLRQTTPANFAAMAKQYGSDGTKDTGGQLGVFQPEGMVAEFTRAVQGLKPGEIGPLARTQYGYHIVRRNTLAEVREQYAPMFMQVAKQTAQSTYVAGVEAAGNLNIRPNAGKVVKEVATDLAAHRRDRTTVATSVMGTFTAGDVARWISGWAQRDQLRQQLQAAPDSLLPNFVKTLLINELLLRQADSAGIVLDSTETASVRDAFKGLVLNTWAGLRVEPGTLADSAADRGARQRLAATRADDYVTRLLAQQERFIEIPPPLADALREKYDGDIRSAGIDRAVELATKIRAASDSAKAAARPPSAVPVPSDTGTSR